jgi:predicted small lipoprotein YifL
VAEESGQLWSPITALIRFDATLGGAPVVGVGVTAPILFSALGLAWTGAPSMSMCTVSPTSVTPGVSAAPFTVTVTTQAPSARCPAHFHSTCPSNRFFSLALAFALILLLFFRANSIPIHTERRALLSSLTLLLSAVLCLAACGGGGYSPPSNLGTPKGTYTLTVIGTANSVSHTLTLTLNVN